MAEYLRSHATLSACERYRYELVRVWDDGLPYVAWVMLNPSTADASKDDPTIRKCVGFAKRWGFGGIVVVNLFAFRATHPSELRNMRAWVDLVEAPLPGVCNDNVIRDAVFSAGRTVLGWGANVSRWSWAVDRALKVKQFAMDYATDGRVWALGFTGAGQPLHPLMVPYAADLVEVPR